MTVPGKAARPWRGAVALVALLPALLSSGCVRGPVAEPGQQIRMELSSTPSPPVSGAEVHWTLHVVNDGNEPAALVFRNTQRGDVRLSTAGVHVYRWAENRAFTRDRAEVVIPPGSSVSYQLDERALPVAPGEYELLATLSSTAVPGVVRGTVTVETP